MVPLGDYDKGKPLTARRILAVKAAIDADGSAKLNTFRSADSATVALNKGWSKAELPQIGVTSNEYAPVDYTLTKDNTTGAADMAKTIAAWQPIKEDGERVQSIENVFMQNFNEQIDDAIADVSKEKPKEFTNKGDEIATQIKADANRNVYTINGQVYDHQPADKVIPAFKNAVKGTANRQGIS